jgi:hypothetical protein
MRAIIMAFGSGGVCDMPHPSRCDISRETFVQLGFGQVNEDTDTRIDFEGGCVIFITRYATARLLAEAS